MQANSEFVHYESFLFRRLLHICQDKTRTCLSRMFKISAFLFKKLNTGWQMNSHAACFLLTNCERCPMPIWKNIQANGLKKNKRSLFHYLTWVPVKKSSVGIATGYEMDGPESKPGGGRAFLERSRPAPTPNQPSVQWVMSLFAWSKAAGAWCWPPTPSSAEGDYGKRCTYTASTMCLFGTWRDSLCL